MERENKHHAETLDFERRKHPRFYLDLPITYFEMDSSNRHNARAINASEGGMMVYFRENVPVGSHLRAKLSFLIDSKPDCVEMQAKVVWKEIVWDTGWGDYRCGVEFVDISQENLSKLKHFLMTLPK